MARWVHRPIPPGPREGERANLRDGATGSTGGHVVELIGIRAERRRPKP